MIERIILAVGILGMVGALVMAVITFVNPPRPGGDVSTPSTQVPSSPPPSTPPATQAAAPAATVTSAPPTTAPQSEPSVVSLGMADFTAACEAQKHDPSAVPEIVHTVGDPPSYWVKCYDGDQNLGGISLADYCSIIKPGTQAYNPKEHDYSATNDGWLFWECVPA